MRSSAVGTLVGEPHVEIEVGYPPGSKETQLGFDQQTTFFKFLKQIKNGYGKRIRKKNCERRR